jgi:aspartyl-tRNA(Asn)/glutamyl-tRNA(Gln) amidotransferase subunit C
VIIDKKIIKKLAQLSKLKFSDSEMGLITKDMTKMIDFINELEEVDTGGLEPLIHMNEEFNNLREDEVKDMLAQSDALYNSPVKDSTYFKLPKVLDKG